MTPSVKRRSDSGTVWERVEKGVMIRLGTFHWCNSGDPEMVTDETPAHVCSVWERSEDQTWQPPELPKESLNSIDALIQRVQLTGGDLEGNNIPVLAMLYQAKALEKIAEAADEWLKSRRVGMGELLSPPQSWEGSIQNRGGSTPLQTQSGGSGPEWPCSCVHNGLRCSGRVSHIPEAALFICDKCGDFPHDSRGDKPQRPAQESVRSGVEPPDVK